MPRIQKQCYLYDIDLFTQCVFFLRFLAHTYAHTPWRHYVFGHLFILVRLHSTFALFLCLHFSLLALFIIIICYFSDYISLYVFGVIVAEDEVDKNQATEINGVVVG